MSDPTPQSSEDADLLSLKPEERAGCRMALQARMALSLTPEEKTDIRRVLQQHVYAESVTGSSWSWFRFPAMAMAAFVLLAASSGGIVYAAEYALPGDALYSVKIHVNEAVRARIQRTPEERAQWALIKLQRRIEEMHRLKANGRAEADIDVAIGDSIEATAHEVEAGVEALPAAAAERAAMRTAVRAAIGTEMEAVDLHRASRVNRVLKALRDRAEQFEEPLLPSVAPVPSAVIKPRESSVPAQKASSSLGRITSSVGHRSSRGTTAVSSAAGQETSVTAGEDEDEEAEEPAVDVDVPEVDLPDVDVDMPVEIDGTIDVNL